MRLLGNIWQSKCRLQSFLAYNIFESGALCSWTIKNNLIYKVQCTHRQHYATVINRWMPISSHMCTYNCIHLTFFRNWNSFCYCSWRFFSIRLARSSSFSCWKTNRSRVSLRHTPTSATNNFLSGLLSDRLLITNFNQCYYKSRAIAGTTARCHCKFR